MNVKIINFFYNSFKNWNQCINFVFVGFGNKVDGFLFFFYFFDVVGQIGLFRVRVGGVEFKQFGQTSFVGLVFNYFQFNVGKNDN